MSFTHQFCPSRFAIFFAVVFFVIWIGLAIVIGIVEGVRSPEVRMVHDRERMEDD